MRGLMLFWKNKSGSTAVEYGLLISIIAMMLLAGLGSYYGAMNNMFDKIDAIVTKPVG